MREIDEGNSSSVELISTSGEGFVRQGIKEVSAVVSRFSVDPESVRSVEISTPGLSDTEIAEKLGKIEIYDQELKNPDLSTDDGVVQAAIVTEAKVLSLIETIPDKKVQSRLQKFGNDILAKTGQVIARVGGKKGVALTMSFLTVLSAACTPAVVGSVMVIPGGGSRATATEVSPQVSPTTAPTETQTPSPTAIATKAETSVTEESLEKKKDYMCGGFPELKASENVDSNTVAGLVGISSGCTAMGESQGTLKFFSFGSETKLPASIDLNKAKEIVLSQDTQNENPEVSAYDLKMRSYILGEWTDRQGVKTDHGVVMTVTDGFGAAAGFGTAVPENGYLLVTEDGATDLLKDYELFHITINN